MHNATEWRSVKKIMQPKSVELLSSPASTCFQLILLQYRSEPTSTMKAKSALAGTACPPRQLEILSTDGTMSLLTAALLMAPTCWVQAQYQYATKDHTITITSYTGSGGAVAIPEMIDHLPVVSIGDGAFARRTAITSVVIPDTVTNIGEEAFTCMDADSRLTELKIGRKVTRIGKGAFAACNQLDKITITDSVTSIGKGAFEFCSKLTGITIPASVTNIEDLPFGGCFRLEAIKVAIGNPAYVSVDGVLYDKSLTRLLQFPAGKSGGCVIPNGVTNIAHLALWNCPNLNSVTIPEGVTSIGSEEFAACRQLETIVVPASVTNIGQWAFMECQSMKGLYFCGNAPDYGEYWRGGRAKVLGGLHTGTVFYLAGTTGWGTNFGGRPTAQWVRK